MTKRSSPQGPELCQKEFTLPEIEQGLRKLGRRIEEARAFDLQNPASLDARIATLESNIRETLREVFGPSSPEFWEHQHHDVAYSGIDQTVTMLEGLVARLREKQDDLSITQQPTRSQDRPSLATRRVFLVHGHDEEAKQTVARFLETLRLEPVILGEQASEGRTLIEKFEKSSDVAYAIVVMTPDDIGRARSAPSEAAAQRPRQNVLLELGYFLGKLSRARVCPLVKGNLELPTDYHGVVYIAMDPTEGWKMKLAKELKQAGLDVDLNLAL